MKRGAVALAAAALVFYIVLAQPNHPDALTWEVLVAFPLEWPALLLAFLAFGPGRAGRVFRSAVIALLMLIVALKTADFAMFVALARGFNPVADLALIDAGLRLLTGAVGALLTVFAALGVLLLFAALGAALWWASGVWSAAAPRGSALRGLAAGAALLMTGVAAAEVGVRMKRWESPVAFPGTAFTARVGVERLAMARNTLADLRAFERVAARDPYADASGLLDLIDRDVLVVFIESYGRTSLDTPLFADLHRATLAHSEALLEGAGLSMASGLLASPTRGGQSWLAHATFANGLWVDGQTRYGAMLASGRQTLYHLAADAGFHTAAVMPQITLDWPESSRMGFETILAAADLGYAGRNFNWVTMPDQFVYTVIERRLRGQRPDDRPYFIQFATGSSHAPWVPVPDLVDWEAVGDGRVFDAMAASGEAPDVVWRDRDRVRAQYRLAIDYALRTAFAWAARQADEAPLMIVLGDHQAAGFVALDERPDVPIHLVGPSHLVERAARDWGLTPGLIPAESTPVVAMDRMRDRILRTYSSSASQLAAPATTPAAPAVPARAAQAAAGDGE
ncbi:MAG: sulfatase-like hydrolase/transferase [Halieaceae bacterium]|jgi:hypothetical protein|nr:sulfatase-like hydrolase/transferase [Halieaceae bacterium]